MSIQISRPDKGLALILGARSWIGYHLTQELESAGWTVKGTSSCQCTVDGREFLALKDAGSAAHLASKLQPQLIVNLLIGITENEYAIHEKLLRIARKDGAFYVFSSSALALDGYKNEALVESLEARSVSEYGKFKGRCEGLMRNGDDCDGLILRFSSIHGWSPYKATRTVNLLEKVRRGERIEVSPGVVQNRVSDRTLVETIVSLIEGRATGVAHIGTEDQSEELDFLRRLAETFGYEGATMVAGEPRAVNLAVVPELGRNPSGPVRESDTLLQLFENPNLQQYKNDSGKGNM